jgi:hypothetical protein
VRATSSTGAAVEAISASGHGVHATSGSTVAAVLGESTGGVGVTGTSDTGVGVRATSHSGAGLSATSAEGIGATFQGSAAAIRLIPASSGGHPTTGHHLRGEIVVDHTGRLWVCTKVGTPGTWRQVAFV